MQRYHLSAILSDPTQELHLFGEIARNCVKRPSLEQIRLGQQRSSALYLGQRNVGSDDRCVCLVIPLPFSRGSLPLQIALSLSLASLSSRVGNSGVPAPPALSTALALPSRGDPASTTRLYRSPKSNCLQEKSIGMPFGRAPFERATVR